ncbi:GH116 family glycosyl-hydrolase [Paraflavitalea speifideaquila]|uniref:GH116 family glycosyl-hydrolase n=1 Tax=Paraflavitalea speifideaquila TaxID=3076558 RepID=UPI0028E18C9F|nr:GH116 family glycosyl-hydrolase [Paraflavitalea speifideiaquila]
MQGTHERTIASRRKFIGQAGLTSAGLLSFKLPLWTKKLIELVSIGKQPLHNIPANKNLDPAWVRSLYQRTHVTTYLKSKNELKYIGMPAGGLHAGTVYLGGDGRLWLWGIYNDAREGIDPKTVLWNDGTQEVKVRNRDGASYVEPAIASNKRVLEQGFAIKLEYNGHVLIKELKEEDWEEIKFEATYPTATIHYLEAGCPVEVIVKAGGIFIPLDADSSAIPATIYSITLKNKTNHRLTASIVGWFENGARKISAKEPDGVRQNTAIHQDTYCSILGDFKATNLATPTTVDEGSTCITLVGGGGKVNTNAAPWPVDNATFTKQDLLPVEKPATEKLVGSISTQVVVAPGKTVEANFVLSWHFNHPLPKLTKLKDTKEGYYYGKRFKNAGEAGAYIAQHFQQLFGQTLL